MNTKTRPAMNVYVRWMIRRDMPEVLAIEASSFAGDAWTEEYFLRCLRTKNVIGMVAELGDSVYGYIVRQFYKDTVHLCNFAVHPDHRRRGVGAAMIEKAKSKLSETRRYRIIADVAESNLPAQLFFRAQGFRCTKVIRGGCPSRAGAEDAYRMVYVLPGREAEPIWQNRIRQYEDRT